MGRISGTNPYKTGQKYLNDEAMYRFTRRFVTRDYDKLVREQIPKARKLAGVYESEYILITGDKREIPQFFQFFMNELCADFRPNFNKKSAVDLCEEIMDNVRNRVGNGSKEVGNDSNN